MNGRLFSATDACLTQSCLCCLCYSWYTHRKATSLLFRNTSNNKAYFLITPRSRRTTYGFKVGIT